MCNNPLFAWENDLELVAFPHLAPRSECPPNGSWAFEDVCHGISRYLRLYIQDNVGKTIINNPPNHHFYRWYKPFPNGWFMALFYQHYHDIWSYRFFFSHANISQHTSKAQSIWPIFDQWDFQDTNMEVPNSTWYFWLWIVGIPEI